MLHGMRLRLRMGLEHMQPRLGTAPDVAHMQVNAAACRHLCWRACIIASGSAPVWAAAETLTLCPCQRSTCRPSLGVC